jgi:branched-chain amino acid transport system substrate-binding protein
VPTFDACAAFDIMSAIYTIAKQLHGNLDPEKTIEAVRGMHFESPRGPVVIDPQSRAAVENVYIRRIERRKGRLMPVEIATYPMVRDPNEP